jgi:hypothetical protein
MQLLLRHRKVRKLQLHYLCAGMSGKRQKNEPEIRPRLGRAAGVFPA